MKSILSASHLLRRYVLFALTVIFTLTLVRAVLSLWKFPQVVESGALVDLFVTGLRFDVALVSAMLLLPVILVTLLGMFGVTRHIGTFLLIFWLCLCLLYVFATELITPWFIDQQGIRPDLAVVAASEGFLPQMGAQAVAQPITAGIAVVLAILIFVAFVMRLEIPRLLRYRLARPSATALMLVGGLLCVVGVWSQVDPRNPPLSPTSSLISTEQTVNELAMNTGYKFAYSTFQPYGLRVRELLSDYGLVLPGQGADAPDGDGADTGAGAQSQDASS